MQAHLLGKCIFEILLHLLNTIKEVTLPNNRTILTRIILAATILPGLHILAKSGQYDGKLRNKAANRSWQPCGICLCSNYFFFIS
jgi:hypothetical protein